eukprot:3484071-Amphidinium_carterae.1
MLAWRRVVGIGLIVPGVRTRGAPACGVEVSSTILGRSSPALVGYGIEDVNHELYGGLYSQMVYGEDFEEPVGMSGVSGDVEIGSAEWSSTWEAVGDAGSESFGVVGTNVFNGAQAQVLNADSNHTVAVLNRGLQRQGFYIVPSFVYEGYLYARKLDRNSSVAPLLTVSFVSHASTTFASASRSGYAASFSVATEDWTRFAFNLTLEEGAGCRVVHAMAGCRQTPEGECLACDGGLQIMAAGAAVVIDFVFLQPGAWGRFAGLPVRADVVGKLKE